ncbi:MAG: hypothetical protein AAFV53_02575 [Myxococcota bacterium]
MFRYHRLPLPLIHPDADPHHRAVARGEAWVDPDGLIRLPPGRQWGDNQNVPLWQWPPRLTWPPPRPNTPEWYSQQITLAMPPNQRTAWQPFALKRTGPAGILLLPRSSRIVQLDAELATALGGSVDRLARLIELGAPTSLIRAEVRDLQRTLESTVVGRSQAVA